MKSKFTKISQFIDKQDDVLNTAEWEARYKNIGGFAAGNAATGLLFGGPAAVAPAALNGALLGGATELAKSAWWKFLDSNEKKITSNIDNALLYYAQVVKVLENNVHDNEIASYINSINSLLNELKEFNKEFIYEKKPYTDSDIQKTTDLSKSKTVSNVCPECNGYKKVSCSQCHGSKQESRKDSKGDIISKGEIITLFPCQTCNAKGFEECKKCKGTGKSANVANKFVKLSQPNYLQEPIDHPTTYPTVSFDPSVNNLEDHLNTNKVFQNSEVLRKKIQDSALSVKEFKDYLEYIKNIPFQEKQEAIKFLQTTPMYKQYFNTDIVKNWWSDIIKQSPDMASKFRNIVNAPNVQNIIQNPVKTLGKGVINLASGIVGEYITNVVIDESELKIDGVYGYCKKRFDYTLAYLSSAYTILQGSTQNIDLLIGFYTQCKNIKDIINNVDKKLYELEGNK